MLTADCRICRAAVAAAVVTCGASACAGIVGFDGVHYFDAEAGAPRGDGAQPDGNSTAHRCPSGHGPVMVRVGTFCIDSTEVTSEQYNDFLLAGPAALAPQPAECSWNVSYLPGGGWVFDPSQPTLPIANVDWCDAYAFCRWAGSGSYAAGCLLPSRSSAVAT